MNHSRSLDILSGAAAGLAPAALRAALYGAQWPYRAFMCARRWAYKRGVLPSRRAAVPVVSVGNITTGGTGKTPAVAYLADKLWRLGAKPAVILRGYKSVGGRSDEAELLRLLLGGGVDVIVDADRPRAARAAVSGGATVCVLDDGFQHMRLRRDLDIVLIDATNPWGYGHCLPRGLMREPPRALFDAHAVVITRSDRIGAEALDALRSRLRRFGQEPALAVHRPTGIVGPAGTMPPAALAGKRVFAFAGLGNPQAFFGTLESLGANLAGRVAFEDHANYTPQVLDNIAAAARRAQAQALVTTQKDAVKLHNAALPLELWTLSVRMEVIDGEQRLLDLLAKALTTGSEVRSPLGD